MPTQPRPVTALALLALLAGCGRDAPPSADQAPAEPAEPEAAAPAEPEAAEPEAAGPEAACDAGALVDAIVLLDPLVAGATTDVRFRWTDPQVPWDCCPDLPAVAVTVDGAAQVVEEAAGSDADGQWLDARVTVDAAAADSAIGLQLLAGCAQGEARRFTVQAPPTADARAALAACEAEDDFAFDRLDEADLRITGFELIGEVRPGATVTAEITMAEVAGVGHGAYPGVVLATDPPLEIPRGAGQMYATLACDPVLVRIPVTIPADHPLGASIEWTAMVGGPLCMDHADCEIHDTQRLHRRVLPAR